MNNLKIIAITLLSFMLLSCIPAAPPVDISAIYQASSAPQSSSTRRSSSTSRTRRSGGCQTRACEDICEDIYEDGDEGDGVIDRCLKLSERTLYTFETIIDYLAEPTLGNVRTVKEEYLNEFEDLLDVSQYPWVDIAEHVNRSEAEALLVFIASSESVTEVLNNAARNYEGYDKYEGVKELLDQVAGGGRDRCTRYEQAFCDVGISGNQTFYSISYSEKNTLASTMIVDLIASCNPNMFSPQDALTTAIANAVNVKAVTDAFNAIDNALLEAESLVNAANYNAAYAATRTLISNVVTVLVDAEMATDTAKTAVTDADDADYNTATIDAAIANSIADDTRKAVTATRKAVTAAKDVVNAVKAVTTDAAIAADNNAIANKILEYATDADDAATAADNAVRTLQGAIRRNAANNIPAVNARDAAEKICSRY